MNMQFSIGKKIGLGFAAALAALLAIGVVAHSNISDLTADSRWVTHTLEVLRKSDDLLGEVMQAENAARGFEASADQSYADDFEAAAGRIPKGLEELRKLTGDNAAQHDRVAALEPLITRRLDVSRRIMQLTATPASDNARQTAELIRESRQRTADIRQAVREFEGEERRLLKERQERADRTAARTGSTIVFGTLIALTLIGAISILVTRSITSRLRLLVVAAEKVGSGDYQHRAQIGSKDEVGGLADSFNRMAAELHQRKQTLDAQDWLKTTLARFSRLMVGQRDLTRVCQSVLDELADALNVRHGALYLPDSPAVDASLRLAASYASEQPPMQIEPGQGLVGQCFVSAQAIRLDEVPGDYIKISSALGRSKPASIALMPAVFDGRVKAVLEIATLKPLTDLQLAFLSQWLESFAVVLNTIHAGMRTEALLAQATALSESLKSRQLELSDKNQELEAQAAQLRTSERLLQEQQEELTLSNAELEQANHELQHANQDAEEQTQLLAEQKAEVERTNREIEQARIELERRAAQLSTTSKYKSEFLANMSHELRTPLNSLLILSTMLAENGEGNLTEKQVRFAQTIHSSGNDLLELISDVLDLAKIESGTVEVDLEESALQDLADMAEQTFRHIADNKQLAFSIVLADDLPPSITTDARRLRQIVKNLLSNAFKFTERGGVSLSIGRVQNGWESSSDALRRADSVIAVAVTDTGIGIPAEKQRVIFEAFQQGEAGTTRKFGGTGLGLSISRELARLLGGALEVESSEGRGSTFTLYLPATLDEAQRSLLQRQGAADEPTPRPHTALPVRHPIATPESGSTSASMVDDDRATLVPGDVVLLIVEDDKNFARVLVEFARNRRFRAVVAHTAADGIALARQLLPAAITLDVLLPDNDGWVVLDRLKHDPATRHIPVHLISVEEQRDRALRQGALSFLQKPVTGEVLDQALNATMEFIQRPVKNLLLVEDSESQRQSIVELIGNSDVHTTAVGTATDALRVLQDTRVDCVVLDLGLPDMHGIQFIKQMHKLAHHPSPPIIVYTGRELSREDETELRLLTDAIVIKDVRSPERLLDETALFLHRVQAKLPVSRRRMIEQVQRNDAVLSGRKVLVVDDDVRNIFAITSALESCAMHVLYAESGRDALAVLEQHPDVDVVLMDVMMPDMDGFETIRRIRQGERWRNLPIISVTAKAMKGDREKCLHAGASDYITKPVDMDQLRSLLRVWLYR